MNNLLKVLSITFISTFIFGCSSNSIQYIDKPDINQPIDKSKTIIKLNRASHFIAKLNNASVVANDKLIGELADGDSLSWKTGSNSLECISVSHKRGFLDLHIKLEDTPVSYKCFETKPQDMMVLTYDFAYPEMRAARELAFTPIFKSSPTFDRSNKVSVNIIDNTPVDDQPIVDKVKLLDDAIKKQFGTLLSTSDKVIDIEIIDYKSGSAAGRWVMSSMENSTFTKVKVIVRVNNKVIETFITRPVVSKGGFLSAGADEYIFDEVAEDIYLHLFGKVD